MQQKDINFSINIYPGSDSLSAADAALVTHARQATRTAYAPYSHFSVGAAALLTNGEVLTGTNQENAAYPVGICAERVLLSAISALHPGMAVQTLAISYHNTMGESNHPISPCGICRQSLVEYEQRTQQPIRLLLTGMEGEVYEIATARHLLPLGFSASDMDKK